VRFTRFRFLSLALLLSACSTSTESLPPSVLLSDDFNVENQGLYQLNYHSFMNWDVVSGSVDLVGTPPFDDFLPKTQGLYVDLDGTSKAAGTLQTKQRFKLVPGTYRVEFKMSGTPRPNQPPNTVAISVGDYFSESITLESFAPLQTYTRTFAVNRKGDANLRFTHSGGDDYGNFIDDIRFERL
jgi:hypothetical protein